MFLHHKYDRIYQTAKSPLAILDLNEYTYGKSLVCKFASVASGSRLFHHRPTLAYTSKPKIFKHKNIGLTENTKQRKVTIFQFTN